MAAEYHPNSRLQVLGASKDPEGACGQVSLINTTITCYHPAPIVHVQASSNFQPQNGVIIAICILSPIITLVVTCWVRCA